MKRLILSWILTPKRARKIIANVISCLLYRCMVKGAWDVVSALPKWLRKIADFIDRWNETELTEDKDRLITELVGDAITDEAVDRLVDVVSSLEVKKND